MIRPDLAQRVQDWIAEDMPDDVVADALIRDLWAECLRRNITVVEQRIAKVILDLKREKEAAVLRADSLTEEIAGWQRGFQEMEQRAEAAEARAARLTDALQEAEHLLSDGDYGEDPAWREALNKVRAALASPQEPPT
jgi:hypothetical protein